MSFTRLFRFLLSHPCNRDQKISAIVRMLKWQVISRLYNGPFIYNWIGGSKFYVSRGETGLTGNIYAGLHEFQDMAFLLHFLRDGDIFADIGANAGSYTLLASAVVGADSYAFEPVPDAFRRLTMNMQLNDLSSKVKCINKGVGACKGEIRFTGSRDTMNHALAPDEHSEDEITVELVSLDEVFSELAPALLKIDVEGYELQVLSGGQSLLGHDSLKAVIMEMNDNASRYGSTDAGLLERMSAHGFKGYSYDPFSKSLDSLQGKNTASGNTIFVRDKAFVMSRLLSAGKFSVHGCEL